MKIHFLPKRRGGKIHIPSLPDTWGSRSDSALAAPLAAWNRLSGTQKGLAAGAGLAAAHALHRRRKGQHVLPHDPSVASRAAKGAGVGYLAGHAIQSISKKPSKDIVGKSMAAGAAYNVARPHLEQIMEER